MLPKFWKMIMYFLLPTTSLLLSFVVRIYAINVAGFDTCKIPYIISRNFRHYCDRREQIFTDIFLKDQEREHIGDISPLANVTAAALEYERSLWTYEPFCIDREGEKAGLCVYTNAHFANGRGISIVATPKEIIKVTQASIFKNSTQELENHAEGARRYEQIPVPGKGLGNVANATFERGEKLQTFTPILAFQNEVMQHANEREKHLLQKMAVWRLPRDSRNMFMELLGHWGGDPYHDRINTNSFAAKLGEAEGDFWAVLPETSVNIPDTVLLLQRLI